MSAALGAADWREFWRSRGMQELRALLEGRWEPLAAAAPEAADACAFRIASLLGSRASRRAIAAELGRIRWGELSLVPAPYVDAEAAAAIATWFAVAGE